MAHVEFSISCQQADVLALLLSRLTYFRLHALADTNDEAGQMWDAIWPLTKALAEAGAVRRMTAGARLGIRDKQRPDLETGLNAPR
jgi:hypothetical protein